MHEPTIISPPAELDVATVDAFRDSLGVAVRTNGARVVIDLSEVGFIDSTALAAIIEANRQLRHEQRQLAIVAPRGTAAAVLLTLSGLRSALAVYDSRSAALRDGRA
ncbi:STAS domain-containing protein [Solirubrobacter phytolaccae]|uniref:STAS domain-containing protein n=1 Tax=Solirubrobacter phytolaccae TaxID=1404360 RepID=A0A9X3N8T3_9ACTN|nr:STAS domain-containing protein [Solirubrobacter phytolaccae]MDA0181888.1 STAS domain-containing protein [Solirubrobacter phytolaccae]